MPSTTVLRCILGASLGLGAIDLVLIDVALAPDVVAGTAMASPRTVSLPATTASTAAPVETPRAVDPPAGERPRVEPSGVVDAPAVGSAQSHVYFATMSAALDDAARATLDGLATGGTTFVLEGHADARGAEAYNRTLSRNRALAVKQYLMGRGAEHTRIEVRYTGKVGANDPALWRDRRVDIQITGGPR
jgi:outer membrane protein OmpA-like peptidoglycan-associated protein